MSAVNSDSTESKMLDSIKATLTRVLGPESAKAVEFYVDEHLALKDPAAFEQALADFLGSQAGGLIIEAIKSDLRNESGESKAVPGPVSKFLSHKVAVDNRPPSAPAGRRPPNLPPSSPHFERFLEAAKQAMGTGVSFKDLVTQGLCRARGRPAGTRPWRASGGRHSTTRGPSRRGSCRSSGWRG